MNVVDCRTERPNEYAQAITLRGHALRADLKAPDSTDTAPGPHDYFDTALAACKALTVTWYAKRKGIPLERVESHVESDDSEERQGVYKLKVSLTFHGPLNDEQRAQLLRAASSCPIHKLMTTSDVQVETVAV